MTSYVATVGNDPAPVALGYGSATKVYVALLGAQPMPPLVGLQTHHNVSQVYLLSTPQVYATGQRLKTVLETRAEWQGRVHLLAIQAAQPVTVRQQLEAIHLRHPQADISINLTGGTKALALHAELWAQGLPFAHTEYTQGQQVHRLQQQFSPQWHLTLQEELELRGVQAAEIRPLPPFHLERRLGVDGIGKMCMIEKDNVIKFLIS